jgi:hypothetical protein
MSGGFRATLYARIQEIERRLEKLRRERAAAQARYEAARAALEQKLRQNPPRDPHPLLPPFRRRSRPA